MVYERWERRIIPLLCFDYFLCLVYVVIFITTKVKKKQTKKQMIGIQEKKKVRGEGGKRRGRGGGNSIKRGGVDCHQLII